MFTETWLPRCGNCSTHVTETCLRLWRRWQCRRIYAGCSRHVCVILAFMCTQLS